MTAAFPAFFSATMPFACAALLVAAAANDFAARIIPNRIPLLLLALGLVLHIAQGSLWPALATAGGVFAVLFLLWRFGVMGGGDVKLLAATAFCVAPATVPALIVRVGLAGGVLGVAYLAARLLVKSPRGPAPRPMPNRRAPLAARVLRAEAWRIGHRSPLPYGIAIAVGGLLTLI